MINTKTVRALALAGIIGLALTAAVACPAPTPTAVPPTAVPTKPPATAVPPTAIPPTAVPPTATSVPIPAKLTAAPSPLKPATILEVKGTGFKASERVDLTLAGAVGGKDLALGSATAGADGSFTLQVGAAILEPVAAGKYTLNAKGLSGSNASAALETSKK
ncbi:MAG: hypothetical protein HY687_02890 [Chloroflexi bacterium]|nr:hypothetical protein [Chloroflexota bacterium]